MPIGDIGSILETVEYDTAHGILSTVLKLADGVIAIWYTSGDNDGWVKTYPVSASGDIGALLDSWEFEATSCLGSYFHPCVVPVAGNIFAVCYRGFVAGLGTFPIIQTMTIGTDGTITKNPIADNYFSSLGDPSVFAGFIRKPSTNTYIAFWNVGGLAPDGYLATFNIDADGTNLTLLDSWEFDATQGQSPTIIHISGHIFAIVYNNGSNRIIKTFAIADNGIITKSWIDTEIFGTSLTTHHSIIKVSGNVYAIFSSATNQVKTFTISNAGAITAIDAGSFYGSAGANISPLKIKQTGGICYFVYSFLISGWHGYIGTLDITDAGVVGSLIDSQLIISNVFDTAAIPVEVRSGVFVFPWSDTPGGDGFISTAIVTLFKAAYPGDSIARVSSIRHICRPGFYRMQVGLGDLGLDIDVAEATVRKALDTTIEAEPPPPMREVMPGRLPPRPGIIEPEVVPSAPGPLEPSAAEKLLEARVKPPDYFPVSGRVTGPQPVLPGVGEKPGLWQRITPWKEEAGETFSSKVAERVRKIAEPYVTVAKFIGRLFGGRR